MAWRHGVIVAQPTGCRRRGRPVEGRRVPVSAHEPAPGVQGLRRRRQRLSARRAVTDKSRRCSSSVWGLSAPSFSPWGGKCPGHPLRGPLLILFPDSFSACGRIRRRGGRRSRIGPFVYVYDDDRDRQSSVSRPHTERFRNHRLRGTLVRIGLPDVRPANEAFGTDVDDLDSVLRSLSDERGDSPSRHRWPCRVNNHIWLPSSPTGSRRPDASTGFGDQRGPLLNGYPPPLEHEWSA